MFHFEATVLLAFLAALAAGAPWNSIHSVPPHIADSLAAAKATGDVPPWQHYNQSIQWFSEQRLDHFNLTSTATWSQRYFVIEDFWKPP